MAIHKDPQLRRFWFVVPGTLGFGVTASTLVEAEVLARAVAVSLGRTFEPTEVIQDVDVRDLDQGHVIPNMGPPSFRGVWFPLLNL